MNKNLVLVTGQKGGVAKTLVSALLLGRVRAAGTCTVAAYDADGSIGGLQRQLGTRGVDDKLLAQQDPHVGVVAYNIHAADERDMLLNSLEVGSDIVLHDLAGGSLDDLLATVDGSSGRLDNLMETIADCGYAFGRSDTRGLADDMARAATSASAGDWLQIIRQNPGFEIAEDCSPNSGAVFEAMDGSTGCNVRIDKDPPPRSRGERFRAQLRRQQIWSGPLIAAVIGAWAGFALRVRSRKETHQ